MIIIITAILVALVFAIGALAMYGSYTYGEIKGFAQGFEVGAIEASEVYHERLHKTENREG